ncbi:MULTISPECIES: HpcH/HpaI aldolase/citrate lyase family protein [unclassified Solwaraspora]|uniref:HpcH/HpaI aldolase/citrate lyase family protein n=1 Tax=unclassified Solwaraspora TaxID=2627926 RepID=UPI00259BC99A|nr:CoA ester lyase [Solwaraspora sp. WMMA2056]WJK43038.1 CoA ester lyase [Solwaraspora sp. WMMA2056]
MVSRSYLYVPGDDPGKLRRAGGRGADALIVDLEDAVPAGGKDRARETVAAWLTARDRTPGPQIWVRINPGTDGHTDLTALPLPGITGVVLAKTESAAEVAAVDQLLTTRERDQGLRPGAIAVVPLLESAAAILDAREIARAPRVARLQIGEADLAAEIGLDPSPDGRQWAPIRTHLVLVSAAAGIDPPVAPVSTDYRDPAALAESTRELARMGYVGRACIHPAQIPVVNAVFDPDPDTVARARELVGAYRSALAEGTGVFVGADGRMVDLAVVRQAERTLDIAQRR